MNISFSVHRRGRVHVMAAFPFSLSMECALREMAESQPGLSASLYIQSEKEKNCLSSPSIRKEMDFLFSDLPFLPSKKS